MPREINNTFINSSYVFYDDKVKLTKYVFCHRVHVVCQVREDVPELLDLQWVTISHLVQSTEHRYVFSLHHFVTALNHGETHHFIVFIKLYTTELSCLFTPQGARGNDGLPGPAGPPVRIIIPTLHPSSYNHFFFYDVISFDYTATEKWDMNPNIQIYVLSTGACWSCWGPWFPRISRSQGLYKLDNHKPVLFRNRSYVTK